MSIVESIDWLHSSKAFGELAVRLLLIDDDLRSAQLAYRDHSDALRVLEELNPTVDMQSHLEMMAEVFHYAKSFVCAMRRVGRLAEALVAHRSLLGEEAGDEVRIAWRKKKSFFDQYLAPRNAIEHIDGEIPGKTTWILMNLGNDELMVTESIRAEISAAALQRAISLRGEIVSAILRDDSLNDSTSSAG